MNNESGADELRKIVNVLNNTRESALDGHTAERLIQLVRACRASPWDLTPDMLTLNEATYASRTGKLSAACVARLTKELG
jgi:hypothetical protein